MATRKKHTPEAPADRTPGCAPGCGRGPSIIRGVGSVLRVRQRRRRKRLGASTDTEPADRNITSDDLIAELDRLAVDRGYPAVLRCDNGPELACAAMAN